MENIQEVINHPRTGITVARKKLMKQEQRLCTSPSHGLQLIDALLTTVADGSLATKTTDELPNSTIKQRLQSVLSGKLRILHLIYLENAAIPVNWI